MSDARGTAPRPGDLLVGRYRLQEQLGQGASALVFRAVDEQLGRDVAVKVLRDALAASPSAATRFRSEGRAAAVIAHPNVAAVFDVTPEGEPPAIIMEFVDGEDLASMLRRVGPLVPRRAAAIAAQVARGLAAAHARGIVHRDVSARNILISREGRAQIADFGIARALLDAAAAGKGGSTPEGTPDYIAPEVLAGAAAGPAADLYGLGVVLFELLAGVRPTAPGSSPSSLRPEVPAELDRIVAHLLAATPAQRLASATAAADALEAFVISANRTSIPARPVGPAAGAPRALAGTRVSRIAGRAGEGEPESVMADHEEVGSPQGDESLGTRGLLLAIGAVALTAVLLVGGLIGLLRIISAGSSPDANIKVPPLVSLTLAEAIPIAESLGLEVKVIERVLSDSRPVDTILSQSPESGNLVRAGDTIEVRVVGGTGLVVVPDVRGSTQEDARAALVRAGLRLGEVATEWSTEAPVGEVLQQNPRYGLQVAKGSTVNLVVSGGPAPSPSPSASGSPLPSGDTAEVPDLRCMTVAGAQAKLGELTLILDSASSALNPEAIVDTYSPAAGTIVGTGSAVSITGWTEPGSKPAGCP